MLNSQQLTAYSTMLSGRNTFITGKAGVGKSYVINKFIKDCEEEGRNLVVVAPTGVAALNINGVTIHRAFKVPVRPLVEKARGIPEILKEADIILIDEISMCRIDVFDYVAKLIMQANNRRVKYLNKKPLQIIVSGDFFQLPPVLIDKERILLESFYERDIHQGFAFESEYWEYFNFVNVVLDEVIRQSNQDFINALNMARIGDVKCLNYFWMNSSRDYIDKAIMLCGTNKASNEKNTHELSLLETKEWVFKAELQGEVKDSDKATEEQLALKVGARVMTVVNDSEMKYQNGSLGTVISITDNTVSVQIDQTKEIVKIERYIWSIQDYVLVEGYIEQQTVGVYTQFPLKLAYAITIHKSQGQTYDAVNLNPYCWDCGQLYVALSRVRSLENLFLTQYPRFNFLVTSKEVKSFYDSLEITF